MSEEDEQGEQGQQEALEPVNEVYIYPKLIEAQRKAYAIDPRLVLESSQRKGKKLFFVSPRTGRQVHFGDRKTSDYLMDGDEALREKYKARAHKQKKRAAGVIYSVAWAVYSILY